MKEPIEVKDIRAGDLIRIEWVGIETAQEWRTDGSPLPYRDSNAKYYLLERPKPAVELPLEDHHIGWLTAPGTVVTGPALGEWFFGDNITASGFPEGIDRDRVTEWIPATAVPTSALCDLRKQRHTWELGIVLNNDQLAIRHFLAAVDASKP